MRLLLLDSAGFDGRALSLSSVDLDTPSGKKLSAFVWLIDWLIDKRG